MPSQEFAQLNAGKPLRIYPRDGHATTVRNLGGAAKVTYFEGREANPGEGSPLAGGESHTFTGHGSVAVTGPVSAHLLIRTEP